MACKGQRAVSGRSCGQKMKETPGGLSWEADSNTQLLKKKWATCILGQVEGPHLTARFDGPTRCKRSLGRTSATWHHTTRRRALRQYGGSHLTLLLPPAREHFQVQWVSATSEISCQSYSTHTHSCPLAFTLPTVSYYTFYSKLPFHITLIAKGLN